MEIEELGNDGHDVQESAFIPSLPFSVTRRAAGDYDIRSQQTEIPVYSGARSDYSPGDVGKCTSHMIIQDDPQEAFNQVSR
jgi:hypothetical protein